jgi:AcrR family transcriptional regulator
MPTRKVATKGMPAKKTPGRKGQPVKKARPSDDRPTEEKIKEAARKLFTQKGFAATRTRDIAEEAGINLALLNYYFRSKQKLFDLIMMENFQHFLQGITLNFMDEKMTMEERITRTVTAYIDFLTKFPDLPLFILNEIRGNPTKIAARINEELAPARSHFFLQLTEANKAGKVALEPFHFIANLVGLTVFPFVGRPLLQRVTNTNDDQFHALMQERKKLVPLWIGMMMKPTKMNK